MDRIAIFQTNEVDPALEGFRDIFKGVVDRFRTAKVNKGMDPNLTVPSSIKTSTMTRSKSDVKSPDPNTYKDVNTADEITNEIAAIMASLKKAGVRDAESFGVFGKSNISATFVKFDDDPDKWVADSVGNVSMNIYLLAQKMAHAEGKDDSTCYRVSMKGTHMSISLSSTPVSNPSATMYAMMEMFIDYKGGSNINVQDHAAESALEVFAFHQNSAGEFFDASEAFTASMEAFTKAGKKYEAAVSAMGSNNALLSAFIMACRKAGVKFADPQDAADALRDHDRNQFLMTAVTVGMGMTQISSIIKVAATAVGNVGTTRRYNKGKNVYLWVVPLNKKGKPRVYQISLKSIANMLNDDNSAFDMEKVAKKAKFIMKHAESNSNAQDAEPEMA